MIRVGSGWDLHRLVEGRPLWLGGVNIPSPKGEEAHSDGDVLLHAVIDALLGAAALGDIGTHFPPSDSQWKDADSRHLLRMTLNLLKRKGWHIGNLDCTVILEAPRLGPHKETIRRTLAEDLGLPVDAVSVKAKTKEGVDAVGQGEAVEAFAAVLIER
jgi:2-C-methyl-D-erythritol 2,4-cyclodiphosphate synthase